MQLARLLSRFRERGRADQLRVLYYPIARNPYQDLLYGAFGGEVAIRGLRYHRFLGVLPMLTVLPFYRLVLGYSILHIHWPEFRISRKFPMSNRINDLLFCLTLLVVRALRLHVCWTVHNIVPHEQHTSNDARWARRLAASSDVLFVHSIAARDAASDFGFDVSRVREIVHGNYCSIYRGSQPLIEALRDRWLDDRRTTLLGFFGLVREYKGVSDLVSIWDLPKVDRPNLVVAGQCSDANLTADVSRPRAGVVTELAFVPDEMMGSYVAAVDAVCLPFRAVTTSGSALMALSLGRPIIAPRLGALREIPDEVGYFYDAGDPQGLTQAILASSDPLLRSSKSECALEYAKSLTWEKSASETLAAYRSMVGRGSSA